MYSPHVHYHSNHQKCQTKKKFTQSKMRTRTFKTLSLLFLAFEVLVQTRLSVRALRQCQSGSDPLPVPFQMYGSVAFMAIRKAETGAGKAAKACSKASPEGVLAMPKTEAMALDLKTIMENHNGECVLLLLIVFILSGCQDLEYKEEHCWR